MNARKNNRKSMQPQGESPFLFSGRTVVPGQDQDATSDDANNHASVAGTLLAAPGEDDIGPDYSHKPSVFSGRDEVSVYNDQMRERYSMDKRKRWLLLAIVLAVVLVPASMVLPSHILTQNTTLALMVQSFFGRIGSLSQVFSDTAGGAAERMLLWRTIAVFLAGAGLALNGAVYQGTLKNALASPSTLGVMSGATLGNVFYMLFFVMPAATEEPHLTFVRVSELQEQAESVDPLIYFLQSQTRVFCCLGGCAVVVALVLAVAYIAGRGKVSKIGLLITGQVFSAIIASVIEMVRYYIRDYGTEAQMSMLRSMMVGDFADIWNGFQIILMGIPILLGIIIVVAFRNRLNLLAFDDDEAKSMGLSVAFTRNTVIIVCTVLTAVIVSFVGAVGFVGFIVPHLARKLVGPDFRYYIPVSIFLGAAYLLIAYSLMNMLDIFSGSVGTFTSIIGAVFFIFAAVRERARGNADWI